MSCAVIASTTVSELRLMFCEFCEALADAGDDDRAIVGGVRTRSSPQLARRWIRPRLGARVRRAAHKQD